MKKPVKFEVKDLTTEQLHEVCDYALAIGIVGRNKEFYKVFCVGCGKFIGNDWMPRKIDDCFCTKHCLKLFVKKKEAEKNERTKNAGKN